LKPDLNNMKDLHRKSSKDYLELMHLALEMNDKEWFEELAKEKERIKKIEEKIKFELGWKEDE